MGTEEFDLGAALEETAVSMAEASEVSDDTGTDEVPDIASESPTPEGAPETVQTRVVPDTWKPEVRNHWDTLPDEVKDEILRREQDIRQGFEQNRQELDFAKSLRTVLQPYDAIMQQYGVAPEQQVAALMNSHYTLLFGSPEQKTAIVDKILKEYGIEYKPAGAADDSSLFEDPSVKNLREELSSVKSQMTAFQREQFETYSKQVHSTVEQFAADPANKYFNDVATEMVQLIQKGMAPDVKSAYEMACRLNPAVSSKIFAEQQEASKKAAEAEQAARVQKAKAASAVNVSSIDGLQSGAAPKGSVDETMQAVLKNIRSKT